MNKQNTILDLYTAPHSHILDAISELQKGGIEVGKKAANYFKKGGKKGGKKEASLYTVLLPQLLSL